jgi:SnoaL-like domain
MWDQSRVLPDQRAGLRRLAVRAFPAALLASCAGSSLSLPGRIDMATRTPKEIFTAHVTALGNENVDAILANRNEDSVLITAERTYKGRTEIGAFFRRLLAELPKATWGLHAEIYQQNVLYIEWSAKSAKNNVGDGVDTFVFKDGLIAMQTARCSLVMSKLNA